MKKIIVFLFCFFCSMTSVHAEKYDWADNAFAFSSIRTALIYELDTSQAQLGNDILEKSLQGDYLKKASRPHYSILSAEQVSRKISLQQGIDLYLMEKDDPEGFQAAFAAHASKFVQIYVKTKLLEYKTGFYIVPAHTEWRTKDLTDTFTDKDGRQQTITRTISYPEYIPDNTVSTATVKLRFDVYDARTGKAVFSREELRTRDSSDDPNGVFQRMLDSFFNDLQRKMDKD